MTNYHDDPVVIMKAAAEAQIASLKAALREALDKWSAWNEEFDGKFKDLKERDAEHIAELRKFLDDK